MLTGPVKWFDSKKGFGFIVGPEGQDVFVHFSSIEGDGFRSLRDGEVVDYELRPTEKGFAADQVHRSHRGPGDNPATRDLCRPGEVDGNVINLNSVGGRSLAGPRTPRMPMSGFSRPRFVEVRQPGRMANGNRF